MTSAVRYEIPFNRPYRTGREQDYIADVIRRGHASGGGHYTRACEAWLEQRLGAPRVLLTTSCTHALEMAALLLDLRPGDEVVVPSFTFVSTASAFALRGARVVFADIERDTLGLDPSSVERLLTERTRAVVPVHYGGVACAIDEILAACRRRGVAVVEDAAHALFGSWRGRPLGTLGELATLSFHETKNVHCGEGGALILNDPSLVARAEIVREKGTDRARFFRGEVDRYTWVDLGSSYVISEILAAWLLAQLEAASQIQARRAALHARYREGLGDWAEANGVALPRVPDGAASAHHLFHLVMPSPGERDRFIAHMGERGILAVFHYLPLHLSPMGRRLGGREGDCPVTEQIAGRLVRLPMFAGMTEDEQARVIDAARAFRPARARGVLAPG